MSLERGKFSEALSGRQKMAAILDRSTPKSLTRMTFHNEFARQIMRYERLREQMGKTGPVPTKLKRHVDYIDYKGKHDASYASIRKEIQVAFAELMKETTGKHFVRFGNVLDTVEEMAKAKGVFVDNPRQLILKAHDIFVDGPRAMRQAYREIPIRVGEKKPLTKLIPAVGIIAAHGIAVSTLEAYQEFIAQNQLAFGLVGAALYGISVLADFNSTNKVFDGIQKAEGFDIPAKHYEGNSLFFGVKSREERKARKKHKVLLAAELAYFCMAALSPVFASGLVTGRLLAAKSNYRIARRYERAVQLAQSQQ